MPTAVPRDLQRFIAETPWTFAKTYAKTWPHEYIVREEVGQEMFDALAKHVDMFGHDDYFYEHKQKYFDFDGHTYWHMENIINRCLEADTYARRKKERRLPEDKKSN